MFTGLSMAWVEHPPTQSQMVIVKYYEGGLGKPGSNYGTDQIVISTGAERIVMGKSNTHTQENVVKLAEVIQGFIDQGYVLKHYSSGGAVNTVIHTFIFVK